jgi:hypothetical protein
MRKYRVSYICPICGRVHSDIFLGRSREDLLDKLMKFWREIEALTGEPNQPPLFLVVEEDLDGE